MRIKRLTSIIVVAIIAVSMLAACGGSGSSGNGSSDTVSSGPITIAADGKTDAIIVRSEHATTAVTDSALNLHKQYKASLNIALGSRTDDTARKDGVPEIIIGETNRQESQLAKERLIAAGSGRATDFIICAMNGNVVIFGMSEDALLKAVDYYSTNYIGLSVIPGDLNYTQVDTTKYETMNLNGVTQFYDYDIVRSHFETSYITQMELEKLSASLKSIVGYSFNIVEDAYVQQHEHEIVVGGSNRTDLEKITDRDKWQIRISGTKIFLEGGSDYSIAMAVTEFNNAINAGTLTFTDGIFKSGSYSSTIAGYDTGKYYKYTWGDEFDGPAIDESKWYICRPGVMDSVAYDGKKVYRSTDETTYIKDGMLYQVAMRTDDAYYGGFLRTTDIMHFKYGYIELKQITPHGWGFWTALWLNASDYTNNGNIGEGYMCPEIDVAECFGDATTMRPTSHAWPTQLGRDFDRINNVTKYGEHIESGGLASVKERSAYCPDGKTYNDDFHTFGVLWTDKVLKWTCDGKVYCELDTTQSYSDVEALNHFVYINLSHAVMLKNNPYFETQYNPVEPATEEQWQNSNKFIVDYVHLWQIDDCSFIQF